MAILCLQKERSSRSERSTMKLRRSKKINWKKTKRLDDKKPIGKIALTPLHNVLNTSNNRSEKIKGFTFTL
jgi:hypothetical protein